VETRDRMIRIPVTAGRPATRQQPPLQVKSIDILINILKLSVYADDEAV